MRRAVRIVLLCQLACAAFFAVSALPGRGRAIANAHPEERGGGDLGFGGLDFYA